VQTRLKDLQGTSIQYFYQEIIKEIVELRDPTTHRALQALCWIRHAKEPLTEKGLLEAVGAGSTDDILDHCRSLIVLSKSGYLQFSHTTTVTEFLDNPENFKSLGVTLFNTLDLAKRCLLYLDSSKFESIEVGYVPNKWTPISSLYGFGGYAARYWADHVRDVENDIPMRGGEELSYFKFLASKTKRNSMFELNHLTRTRTILHFAAERGLSKLCSLCLEAKARYVGNAGCC